MTWLETPSRYVDSRREDKCSEKVKNESTSKGHALVCGHARLQSRLVILAMEATDRRFFGNMYKVCGWALDPDTFKHLLTFRSQKM